MAISTSAGDLPPDLPAWDALCDESGASPFQRPGWILPWYAAFAPDDRYFVRAFDEGRLVGVLPLRRRFGVTRSATNWHTPLFAPVAVNGEVEERLLREALRGSSALILRFVTEPWSSAAAFDRVARTDGFSVRTRPLLQSPRVDIESPWEEYEKGLSKTMLKTLRRRKRRLEELGRVEVEVVTDATLAEERLNEGLALERAGWKGRRGTAIAADERLRRFYVEMALAAAQAGRLSLAFLRLDGRAVAFHLDLVDGGVLYGLKGTYAEDLRQMSPSRILRHERIEQAFAAGLERYEFLGADEPYKTDWANDATAVVALEAYRTTAAGRAFELANTHGREAARRVHAAGSAARRRIEEARARRRKVEG